MPAVDVQQDSGEGDSEKVGVVVGVVGFVR